MKPLTINQDIQITLAPRQMAELFCNMDSQEQAEFFNHIGDIVADWPGPFCFQLQTITDDPALNNEGREIMADIGEYASKEQS